MKKTILLIGIICLFTSCKDKSGEAIPPPADATDTTDLTEEVAPVATPAPGDDLNGDGQKDYVEVVETEREDRDLSKERNLVIFSGEGTTRKVWYTAKSVLLPEDGGGMMGDPLEGVTVEGKVIVINHFGGSRQKWSYTHRFRWQDGDFRLIGATVVAGSPCDYWENFDYNLSTGKIEYTKTTEDCTNENEDPIETVVHKNFSKKIAVLPSMNGFLTGENAVAIPDMETEMYY